MSGVRVYSQAIRQIILEQSKRAHVGHIGSALSIADIVAALYAALHLRGWLSADGLAAFHTNGSALGVHPERIVRGIDFSTGSLGQGLSMGAGAALGARLQGSQRRVFVLMSDAECNEGSTWEAVTFAAHHRLANLIAIIDLNGQQALGYTDDVMSMSPMIRRWRAFGWDAHEVDGHDPAAIANAIRDLNTTKGRPHVIIARTVSGKGVSFMERQIKWHYWPMSDEEYAQAMSEVKRQA